MGSDSLAATDHVHSWLREISVAFVTGPMTPLLERVRDGLLSQFEKLGHEVQSVPNDRTDVILTTARFGEPIGWRQAPLFYSRRRFGLSHVPIFLALVHAPTAAFEDVLAGLRVALEKEPLGIHGCWLSGRAGFDTPGFFAL